MLLWAGAGMAKLQAASKIAFAHELNNLRRATDSKFIIDGISC
jgi:hypothetical protein